MSKRRAYTFSRRERNGTAVLCLLILVLLLTLAYMHPSPALTGYDFSSFDQQMAAWKKTSPAKPKTETDTAEHFPSTREDAGEHSPLDKKELFFFNPNNLAVNDWERLGLSKAQAQSVKNFEQRGGKFHSKADVKKLYVISEKLYTELEPYIVIPDQDSVSHATRPAPKRKTVIVEINSADSVTLVEVNGIGPAFARRILNYRERLGGFYATKQLLEVFGIDQEHYDKFSPFLKTDSTLIRKINLNTATVESLKKHPYLTWNLANAIVNYRKLHGPFTKPEDLRRIDLVNEDLYRKLAAYITL